MSFRQFVVAERSALVWFVVHQTGASQADADDAVQEALIAAVRSWHEISAPRAWVRKVALRAYWRSAPRVDDGSPGRRFMTVPIEEVTDHGVSPSAAEIVELRDEEDAVAEHLTSLPLKQRQVLTLRYHGYSYPEIAAELKMSEAAVRQNASRAKQALRMRRATGQKDAR